MWNHSIRTRSDEIRSRVLHRHWSHSNKESEIKHNCCITQRAESAQSTNAWSLKKVRFFSADDRFSMIPQITDYDGCGLVGNGIQLWQQEYEVLQKWHDSKNETSSLHNSTNFI